MNQPEVSGAGLPGAGRHAATAPSPPSPELVRELRLVDGTAERVVEQVPQKSARAGRLRVYRLLIPLFGLLVLWLSLFQAEGAFRGGPSGKAFGADFAMFVGAAKILEAGGNPYDHVLLYRTERAYLARQHLPILTNKAIVRVGNPPLFFWALIPLSHLPFQPLSWGWTIVLYLVTAAGFLALLRYFGWRRRSACWIGLVLCLLAPQAVFGPFYGNPMPIVFAAVAGALYLSERYPVAAGMLLSIAWLKPPPSLPIVLLLFLFHLHHRRRSLLGFGLATSLLFVIMVGAVGLERLPEWIHGLVGYSQDINVSPDIASFSGVYVRNAPHYARLFLEMCSIGVALAITALAWHRYRGRSPVPFLAVAWLWVLWFLAAPYAHFFDEVLLIMPLLAVVGRNGQRVTWREPAWGLYLFFASLLLISASPLGIQLLWLPLVGMMLCLFAAGRSDRYLANPPPASSLAA